MALIARSRATFRIFGDDLDPDRITDMLGCEPTFSVPKSGVHAYPSKGKFRIAKTGVWRLRVDDRSPGDVDGQIGEILSKLTYDKAVWTDIRTRFEVDLFCGLWLTELNAGIRLSAESQAMLGTRGIPIEFDIYFDQTPEPEG
jgi:hypothetical protein